VTGVLIDENLPSWLVLPTRLKVVHACDLGVSPGDGMLWAHGRDHDLAMVSKDADFSGRVQLLGPPPKVVHAKIGNLRARALTDLFARVWPEIEVLLKHHHLINVYREAIEVIA